MSKDLYDLMKYVRVDGEIGAKITILSIEDGGGYKKDTTLDEIKKSFESDAQDASTYFKDVSSKEFYISQWVNNKNEKVMGPLAQSLCKIWSYLSNGNLEDVDSFKKDLYSENSPFLNIKYYPLGKQNVSDTVWNNHLGRLFNSIPLYIYKQIARSQSNKIHKSILRSQLDHNSKIIVAGNFDNWAPLLFELFSDRGRYFQRKEQMENRVSAYYDQEGELMFIYSQMIRSAISDSGVEQIGMTGIKI